MATLLSLLLAINSRPTRFVVMAWNRQPDLASQFFSNVVVEDQMIGWYCNNTGQHQLGFSVRCAPRQLLLCCGLRKICSGANLAPESLHTICASGTFRAHRSLLPIAQSPIRLTVVRSSTPSLTKHLSRGTWVPAKSVGDHLHDLHVLLGDVRTRCFVIPSTINNLGYCVAQPCQCCFSQ